MTTKRCAMALTVMLLAVGCGPADENGEPHVTNNGSNGASNNHSTTNSSNNQQPNNGSTNNDPATNGSNGDSNSNTNNTNTNNTNNGTTSNSNNETTDEDVSFSEEIAPLLIAECSRCHGGRGNGSSFVLSGTNPDVDAVRVALDGVQTDRGVALVAPGAPEDSELYLRVSGTMRAVMPLGDPLPSADVDLVERWIQEGASFD